MKKKNNLFKVIIACFLFCVLLTWLIPIGSISEGEVTVSTISPVGLFGLVYVPIITFATFVQYTLVIFGIGGFYGVLAKTGVYSKLVDKVTKKYENKEKLFLIITISTLMVLSSVLGNPYGLLVFVPFLMAIVLRLGYNKITALASTIGAILVGGVASTYGLNVATQLSNVLGTDVNNAIIPKFAFLVITIVLYVLFVCSNKRTKIEKPFEIVKETVEEVVVESVKENKKGKNKKIKEAVEKVIEKVVETKVFTYIPIPFVNEKEEGTKNEKPLVILLGLFAVILFLSMTNWQYMFNVTLFDDIFKKIGAIVLGDVPIIEKFLGVQTAFGYWTSYELTSLLVIFSLLIGWVYGFKLDETFDAFKKGCKEISKTAFLMTLTCTIFTVMLMGSGSSIYVTITNLLVGLTKDFFFLTTAISGLLSGFFYNDFYYALSSVAEIFQTKYDADFVNIFGFIFQTMHNIMMLITPTSILLVGGLSLLDVSIKDWFKYILMFVLQLLVLSIVISIGLVLMV